MQYPFCEILSGCGVLLNYQSAPEEYQDSLRQWALAVPSRSKLLSSSSIAKLEQGLKSFPEL